jgi:hypothetical protein
MFDTPVLLLGFNRPHLFRELINCLREVAPTNIYIAVDGPRNLNANDALAVLETISLIKNIDWECNVHVLKQESNLGCGLAVSTAISWVLELEEMVIILEDDIRPIPSFFEFCELMLQHYRYDERIMTIGGHSTIQIANTSQDYHLSKYPEIWGWATWKRSWDLYKYSLNELPKISFKQLLKVYGGNVLLATQSWMNFRAIRNHSIDTWDYQLVYSSFRFNKLHVIPNYNLTENVGFDNLATHTRFLPVPSPDPKEIKNIRFDAAIECQSSFERQSRAFLQRQFLKSLNNYLKFK